MNQQSPEYIEFDPLNMHTPTTHSLLTVPPKIERHSSEPAPCITPSSPHLLSVPSGPLLVKQHSHPLLPSQSASISPPLSLTSGGGGSIGSGFAPSFALHRQLSHPIPSSSSSMITASEPLFTTMTTVIPAAAAAAITATTCTISTNTFSQNTGNVTAIGGSNTGGSPGMVHFVSTPIKHEFESKSSGGHSPSVILVSDPISSSCSSEHVPTIRVKTEELHRSVSTPQASSTGDIILEPRSSHCPVIRPGPALGCNFCWNTIDAHGRILRRKTKYHCPECQTNLCIVPCFQEYHERQTISDNPSSPGGGTGTSSSTSKNVTSASLRHYPKTGSI